MKPIETIKNLVKRALSVGTPPAKKVLYEEIIKKEQSTLSKIDRPEVKKEATEEVAKVSIETKIPKAKTAEKKQEIKKQIVKKEKTKTVKAKTPTKKVVTPKKTAPKKATIKKTTPKEEKVATVKAKAPAKKKVSTAKKVVTPKEVVGKETIKKEIEKPVSIKKAPTKQSKTAPKMTKKEEKIALYTKDIQKHYHEVDEAFLAIIVKNLGPSIYRKNAELVSCSDPKELDTVRRNFLIKKLGMTQEKDILDGFIQDVCQELKGVSHKYRATFYYRLAKNLKKESALS